MSVAPSRSDSQILEYDSSIASSGRVRPRPLRRRSAISSPVGSALDGAVQRAGALERMDHVAELGDALGARACSVAMARLCR